MLVLITYTFFLSIVLSFFLLLSFIYLPSPNREPTPQYRSYTYGTYNPNARGSDSCRERNKLWTRTLNRNIMADLSECVTITISGPPPKTTQERTQRTHIQSQKRNQISDPAENRIRAARLEGRNYSDHAIATDHESLLLKNVKVINIAAPVINLPLKGIHHLY